MCKIPRSNLYAIAEISKVVGATVSVHPIYRVRQKSSPLEFCFSFLRIALEFQGEILRTYVVIIYVHIGINNI